MKDPLVKCILLFYLIFEFNLFFNWLTFFYKLCSRNKCKNMLKVVLILNEVHIRLKDGELDIILNKEPINILLGKNLKIINGLATINTTI